MRLSIARSTLNVKLLITAKPSSVGGTIRASPDGSRATMAAIRALNRLPRAALRCARARPATDTTASLAAPGDKQPARGCPVDYGLLRVAR